MKCLLIVVFVLSPLCLQAQNERNWQQAWQDVMSVADEQNEESWDDNLERLEQLAENPINLNTATREDLQQLPFLSEQQIMDLREYLDRYGPMQTLGELKMVSSMDYRQLTLLPFFVFVDSVPPNTSHYPPPSTIARYGRHTLTATARMPFYTRKGDRNGYLGYRYRHSLRYEFSYGDYAKAGLLGAQDAGEPFFANRNKWGYDTYSYYVQLKKLGPLQNAIVGKYKVAAGMGLVLNTSFRLGKLAAMQNLGRRTNTLRPHASRSEADYFQGVAATVSLSKPLTVSAFVSYRPIDATLNDDGTAATPVTDGYHRTLTEMEKKNNTHQTAAGTTLGYHQGAFRVNANAVYTHLDRTLEPATQTLYRRYYAQGTDFTNASLDYGYTHYRLSLSGETAVNQDGAIATIHSLSFQPSGLFSLMLLQRFYSYRYSGLYAHAFGENSRSQNESGVFLGTSWAPVKYVRLMAYADYAYFPWARYQVSQASHSADFLLQATYQRQRWALMARSRVHLRQRDNEDKTALVDNNDYRARLSVTYSPTAEWSARTQIDACRNTYQQATDGYMLSEQMSYQGTRCTVHLLAGVFNTDSYDSRIFIYEHQLAHEFSFPTFYGEGMRLALTARADLLPTLRLSARLGYTHYFDRPTIGTGLQQVDGSSITDLDLQLRWRF